MKKTALLGIVPARLSLYWLIIKSFNMPTSDKVLRERSLRQKQ